MRGGVGLGGREGGMRVEVWLCCAQCGNLLSLLILRRACLGVHAYPAISHTNRSHLPPLPGRPNVRQAIWSLVRCATAVLEPPPTHIHTSPLPHRAAEREAGYLVVGALCRSGLGASPDGNGVGGGPLEGRSGQLLGLLALALGEDARGELQQTW